MWERPQSVPFPSVWRTFHGRREINGTIPTFWIQDIPVEEFDLVVDCMVQKFCAESPLCKYSNIQNDKQSIEEIRGMWYKVLNEKLGLICYLQNPDPNGKPIFAGVNCTYKITKSDNQESEHYRGKAICTFAAVINLLMKQTDVFEDLQTDVLLMSKGLYVQQEFRGQNIGLELLKAREDLCKAVGIKAGVTIFSATASQILSDRAGYRVLSQILFDDLRKISSQFHSPGIQNDTKMVTYACKVFE